MSDQLAIRQDQALMPMTFDGLMKQATVIFKSGLLPKSVQSPAAAVAIMLTGRELGITPMQSFRSIYVVDGTPSLSAQFVAAKLLEAGVTYHVPEMTNQRCTIEFTRGNGMTLSYTYTWEDATKAGLAGKRNWRQYPRDMLWSRCMTLGGRKIAPDALLGFHTADELGAVVAPQSGEVIDSVARELPGKEATTEPPEVTAPEPPKEAQETTKPGRPKQRSGGEERQAVAFAKMVYMRWTPMFPEDKDHAIFHTQFGMQSAKDLSGVVSSERIIELLNIVDLGLQHSLTVDQINYALGVKILVAWLTFEASYESGIKAIGDYVDKQAGQGKTDSEVPF